MRLSVEKVRAGIEHFIGSYSDFHLAAFDGDKIVGGIAMAVYESPMWERCEGVVMLCRATDPAAGRELFQTLRAWINNDMRIRRVHFPTEFDAPPAMTRLLRQYGFKRTQVVCAFEKE